MGRGTGVANRYRGKHIRGKTEGKQFKNIEGKFQSSEEKFGTEGGTSRLERGHNHIIKPFQRSKEGD